MFFQNSGIFTVTKDLDTYYEQKKYRGIIFYFNFLFNLYATNLSIYHCKGSNFINISFCNFLLPFLKRKRKFQVRKFWYTTIYVYLAFPALLKKKSQIQPQEKNLINVKLPKKSNNKRSSIKKRKKKMYPSFTRVGRNDTG